MIMPTKKITVRLSDEEITNLQELRKLVFKDSNTDCAVIKYLINNFLKFSNMYKCQKIELEKKANQTKELENKISKFNTALNELLR